METEVLVAIVAKIIDDRLASQQGVVGSRGPRGRDGRPGVDGKDFVFSEHEDTIRAWAKDYALKFQDLTAEQIESLRGPRGRDGVDGKNFEFAEHTDTFRAWLNDFIPEHMPKFEDFTAEQIEAIRGPRGRDGRDGKDGVDGEFVFDEHRESIIEIVRGEIGILRDDFKLKFSDLTEEERDSLRGPRGPRGQIGKPGKGFDFEEHREFFQSLKPKFSDFTDEEKQSLKLQFSHLTEEEKASLKLRFQDLTDDERALLRGPRGVRGQRGAPGRDGKDGKDGRLGPIGMTGLTGPAGRDGLPGIQGAPGQDAPYVVDIDVKQSEDTIVFVFTFSDGSQLETKEVKLPSRSNIYNVQSGGKGKPVSYETYVDEVSSTVSYVGKAKPGNSGSDPNWQISRISVSGTLTKIEYADSDTQFDNVWDDRASLSYG